MIYFIFEEVLFDKQRLKKNNNKDCKLLHKSKLNSPFKLFAVLKISALEQTKTKPINSYFPLPATFSSAKSSSISSHFLKHDFRLLKTFSTDRVRQREEAASLVRIFSVLPLLLPLLCQPLTCSLRLLIKLLSVWI